MRSSDSCQEEARPDAPPTTAFRRIRQSGVSAWRWWADVDGAQGRRRGFLSAQHAAEARATWVHEQRKGIGVAGRGKTLAEFLEEDWLPRIRAKAAAGELRSSTAAQYERDAINHLTCPPLGKKRLRDVTAEDAERLADRLIAHGKSADTARRVVVTLGYALKLARRYRLIAFNPVADAEKPRPRRRQPELPTIEQVGTWRLRRRARRPGRSSSSRPTRGAGSPSASRSTGTTWTSLRATSVSRSSASGTRASWSSRPRREPETARSCWRRRQPPCSGSCRSGSSSTVARTPMVCVPVADRPALAGHELRPPGCGSRCGRRPGCHR